ncbi:MAG: hypothetical protein PUG48_06625 [Clostridia bacterium]|nr:hypothetical protein [Clostridia bacterium]
MKNKRLLSRILLVVFAVFTVMIFSTAVSAAQDDFGELAAIVDNATINDEDNAAIVTVSKDSEKDKPKNMGKVIGIAAGISIVVTGIVVFCIYTSYKTNGKTEPYQYGNKAPLQLTHSTDMLIDTKITKRKIEKNNN